jgi:transcriptional regulator with XRE-family HTH domain
VDVCLVIQQRLKDLGLEQRDLAAAAEVTESYISQLLTRKKAPPAADRTGLYEKMNAFLKLPKGQLSAMVEAQRREELKKELADPPAPLFPEVRKLIIRKCRAEKRKVARDTFEKQAFGELERLVTQKLLDVTKKIVKDELKNETWLRSVAKRRGRSYEEMRAIILEFLDTDVFNVSVEHCSAFLDPLINSWDIDLKTFGMEIALNRRLASRHRMNFQFVEIESNGSLEEEPGYKEFLAMAAMSGDASKEELEFLGSLRFRRSRPSALYYYRELQSLRDPFHFPASSSAAMHKRRDAVDVEKLIQLDSRKSAIQRWADNKNSPRRKIKSGLRSPQSVPAKRN